MQLVRPPERADPTKNFPGPQLPFASHLISRLDQGLDIFDRLSVLPRGKMRTSPNVIITGTPGVGKTVHCEQLAQETGLRHLSINQVAKDRGCFETYDHELETWVVDEDKVRALFSSFPPVSRPSSLGLLVEFGYGCRPLLHSTLLTILASAAFRCTRG